MAVSPSPPALPTLAPNVEPHHALGDQHPQSASTQYQPPEAWVQRAFDDPVAVFTLWLALATTALWFVTYRLWSSTRDLAARANEEHDLAERQLALQGQQTDILEKQKEISRLQFFAEHRPRLLLKDVYPSSADFTEITFEIVNSGNSLAQITGGFVGLAFVSDPRQFRNPAKGANLGPLENSAFKGGAFRPFGLRVDEVVRQKTTSMVPPMEPLYFFGMIFYTDGRGEGGESPTYATVFRRIWMRGSKSFERTGNPDHEYAD